MSKRFAVRYDLLRDQVKYAEAKSAGPAQVSMDLHRKVKRMFTGDLILPGSADPMTDRLRPVLLLDGKEYPLGQFVLTGLRLLQRGKERVFRCEGQDLGYLVLRSRTEKRLFFKKGQRYTDAVQNLLQSCGIRSASVIGSEKVFACDRCDWEVGSSVLDVIDALLEEIGYVSLWFDRNGVAQVHPHRHTGKQKRIAHFQQHLPGNTPCIVIVSAEGCDLTQHRRHTHISVLVTLAKNHFFLTGIARIRQFDLQFFDHTKRLFSTVLLKEYQSQE